MAEQLDLFPSSVLLHRIDPAKNMRRFYAMRVELSLFGEWILVREWGRIGRSGQSLQQWFSDQTSADNALAAMMQIKERRGYRSDKSR